MFIDGFFLGVIISCFPLQVSLKINLLENMPATERTQLVTLKGGVLLSGKYAGFLSFQIFKNRVVLLVSNGYGQWLIIIISQSSS